MSTAINGRTYLVYINVSGTPTLIGGQRDVTFTEGRPSIDASDKDANNRKLIQGQYEASLTFSAIFDTADSGYANARTNLRSGTNVTVHRTESGSSIESATGLITQFTESFPNQDVAVGEFTVEITGAWA